MVASDPTSNLCGLRGWVPKAEDETRPARGIPRDERDYYLERIYPSFGNLTPRDIASRRAKEAVDSNRGVGELKNGVYLDFEDAIERLTAADQLMQDPNARSRRLATNVWFFLAMAHHHLGHRSEAQQWLDKAIEAMHKETSDDDQDGRTQVPWTRRLTLKLLRDEAQALLKEALPGDGE